MAKTTMLISIERDLKDNFQLQAKKMGTNSSNLVSMLMVQFMSSRKPYKYLDLEIEPFTDKEMKDLLSSPRMQKNMKKMNKLLAKI